MNSDSVKDSICPNCGKLLGTSQLVQLNRTLDLLIDSKGIHQDKRTPLIEKVVEEIERVSRQLLPENSTTKV